MTGDLLGFEKIACGTFKMGSRWRKWRAPALNFKTARAWIQNSTRPSILQARLNLLTLVLFLVLRPSLSDPEAARTWQKPLAVLPGIGRGSRRVA
jgi:hypothetical protein